MKNFIIENKRVLLPGVVFIIIIFIGFMVLTFYSQRQLLIDADKQSLQILANEKALHINTFLENQKEKQVIISSVGVFKEAVLYPNDTAKIETAKKRIEELKDIIPGISILNNEGIVVIADIDLPGTDYGQLPYFIEKRQDITFTNYYDPLRKKDYYAVGGPIYDRIEKNKVIGVIAFDVELNKISSLMKETIDGGDRSEVYLIDETGLLLSGSKYIGEGNKNGVLIQEVKSDGAIECLEHLKKYGRNESVEEHTEEVIQYISYMGNEVFGAHAYVPSIMGCVIAEKSVDEITTFSLMDSIKNIFKKEVNNE